MLWRVGNVFIFEGREEGTLIFHRLDGFYYHRAYGNDRMDGPFVTLTCVRKGRRINPCPGRAMCSSDGMHFFIYRSHLGHLPDPWYYEETQLRKKIMDAVAAGNPVNSTILVRNIGISGGFSMEARSRLLRTNIRSTLRRKKLLHYPNHAPETLEHLGNTLLSPQYQHLTLTLDSQDSIFAGVCGNFEERTYSVVFASRRQLNFLQSARKVFADGTFKRRPQKPKSAQLFVLSCVWYNQNTSSKHIVTCVRVLMQSRTQESYKALFTFLKQLIPQWNPEIIVCDCEMAQINGWKWAFQLAIIINCLWHYDVDVYKYAKGLGLHQLMKDNWAVDTVVRALGALPLLPSHRMLEGLLGLGVWGQMMNVFQSPLMATLFDYILHQWVGHANSISVYRQDDRTNNVSESVNATLRLEIPETHPNTWVSIGAFRRLEDQTMIDLHCLRNGRNTQRPQCIKTLRNDFAISNLTDALDEGNITIVDFLLTAPNRMLAAYEHVFT